MCKLLIPKNYSYHSAMEADNHPKTFHDLFASITIDAQNSVIFNEKLYLKLATDLCESYVVRSLSESPLTIE